MNIQPAKNSLHKHAFILMAAAICGSAILTAEDKPAEPKTLLGCLGRDFAAYDAALGTPKISKREEKLTVSGKGYTEKELEALPSGVRESRFYGANEKVHYLVEQPAAWKLPGWIVVSFPTKPETWQEALTLATIPADGITATTKGKMISLEGIKGKDGSLWDGYLLHRVRNYVLELSPAKDSKAAFKK